MNRLLSHVGPPLRALQAVLRNGRITRMQLAFLLFNVAEPAMWVAIFVYAFDQGGTQEVGVVSIVVLVPAGVLAPVAAALGDRFRRERVVRVRSDLRLRVRPRGHAGGWRRVDRRARARRRAGPGRRRTR